MPGPYLASFGRRGDEAAGLRRFLRVRGDFLQRHLVLRERFLKGQSGMIFFNTNKESQYLGSMYPDTVLTYIGAWRDLHIILTASSVR